MPIRRSPKNIIGAVVDRVSALAGPRLPSGSRLRPALLALRHRLPTAKPIEPLTHLVAEFARMYPRAFFIQVGANDGNKGDYLETYVNSRHWQGVLIEPIPYVFAALSRRHGANRDLTLVNAAIAEEDGTAHLYYLPKDENSDLPQWYDALATFRREVLLTHTPWIPDIESRITTIEVPTMTFDSLCEKHGIDHIDLIQIDTEGYDYEVIKQIDFARYKPAFLLYEHYHLKPEDRQACEARLTDHGYRTISNFMDTIAIRADRSDHRNGRLLDALAMFQSDSEPR